VVASRPSISTLPVSGRSRPAMTRSRVDLPLPDGPSRAVSEPLGISTDTSSSAAKSPKRLDTPRVVIDIRNSLSG
jgi:hypothetical protein